MKKNANLFIILVFIIALVLPNALMLLDEKLLKADLNINLNQPLISIGKLKNFYLENYGTKSELVNSYIKFKTNITKEDPIPYRVINGKNGWLFLGNYYNNVFNNSFGNNKLTTKNFNAIKNNLIACNTYLKTKNIDFYTLVAPDKNKIYQEFLPFQLKSNPSNIDLLNKLMPENFKIIDLKKSLLQHKKNNQLYLKTDTHWNSYGAFYGYKEILKKIDKNNSYNSFDLLDFDRESNSNFQGDLSKMIKSPIKETDTKLKFKNNLNIEVIAYSSYYQHYKNSKGNGKIMIYRDSFSNALIPFFNATFNEVILIKKHNLDKNLITSFKPDIVLFEIIERNLSLFEKIKTP
jgi:hypothetical protein